MSGADVFGASLRPGAPWIVRAGSGKTEAYSVETWKGLKVRRKKLWKPICNAPNTISLAESKSSWCDDYCIFARWIIFYKRTNTFKVIKTLLKCWYNYRGIRKLILLGKWLYFLLSVEVGYLRLAATHGIFIGNRWQSFCRQGHFSAIGGKKMSYEV